MAAGGAEVRYEIRRAGPDDWAVLRRVRLAALAEAPYAFGSTLAGETSMPEQHWRDRIAAWPQFMAWSGDEPAGLAAGFAEHPGGSAHSDSDGDGSIGTELGAGASGSWHLVSMWVRPQARGNGIADGLVAAVGACARDDGASRLTLWVTDVNGRALAFYHRMGFRSTGRRQLVRPDEADHWEEEQVLDLSQNLS
jgi:GNAT superfamily N-acetyltransferase